MNLKVRPYLYQRCEQCMTFFIYTGGKRRRWCSDRCKVKHWRNSDKLNSGENQVIENAVS